MVVREHGDLGAVARITRGDAKMMIRRSGELVGAIAMSEPSAGSDLQGIATTTLRAGTFWPRTRLFSRSSAVTPVSMSSVGGRRAAGLRGAPPSGRSASPTGGGNSSAEIVNGLPPGPPLPKPIQTAIWSRQARRAAQESPLRTTSNSAGEASSTA